MRALTRGVLAGALTTGALLASPAHATNCVGEQSLAYFCVTLPEVVVGQDQRCFYLGGDTCTNVDVPTASVVGAVDVDCGGRLTACKALALEACDATTLVHCKA